MPVIAGSPYRMLKSVGNKGDFGHFRLSKWHADGINRLARCDFLLVLYMRYINPRFTYLLTYLLTYSIVTSGLDGTVVEL